MAARFIFALLVIPFFSAVNGEFPTFPSLFGQPTTSSPDGTTQTVNGPIQRLLVCQAIDSAAELQKLASAVAAMDQHIQQLSASSGKDKPFFDLDKFKAFKEAVTTLATTMLSEAPTTPSYGQDGSLGYPKYFFANMSGSDDGYNGNLFPMEIDAWYQPGNRPSYPSQYSRPRPRPRYRPRVRPSTYRRYGARRPVAQPMQSQPMPSKPMLNKPTFNKFRLGARSLEDEHDYFDDPLVSILEPLRPAIRHFLQIAREEQDFLGNELDYDSLEEEELSGSRIEARGANSARQRQGNLSSHVVDNTHRYASGSSN